MNYSITRQITRDGEYWVIGMSNRGITVTQRVHSLEYAVRFALKNREQTHPDALIHLMHNGMAEQIESEDEALLAWIKIS